LPGDCAPLLCGPSALAGSAARPSGARSAPRARFRPVLLSGFVIRPSRRRAV